MPDLLAAADVHAHLSADEGLSNSVLEAFACGLPVVATDEHSHPEQVTEACGILVTPDEAAVALRSPASPGPVAPRRLDEGAREPAVSRFGLDAMIRRYERVLESVRRR